VEINASDDRSVDAFKKSLEAATQMRSVMGEERRPNCLVIDEIDGALAATINLLVSALTGASKSKKKKGGKNLILRPVIAICNDLFTPSLRPLRNLALVLPFPPTLSTRLADRLREITAVEKLKTDLSALLALCKKTDNDIRSCLSTLQFFRKKGHQLRASDVASVSVGSKDSNKSLFSVWESLFAIPR
jgi:chromosome transmission fidelity protein 18